MKEAVKYYRMPEHKTSFYTQTAEDGKVYAWLEKAFQPAYEMGDVASVYVVDESGSRHPSYTQAATIWKLKGLAPCVKNSDGKIVFQAEK